MTNEELAAIQARCDALNAGCFACDVYDDPGEDCTCAELAVSQLELAKYVVPMLLAALREAKRDADNREVIAQSALVLMRDVAAERDELRAEVKRLKELRAHGCECGDDDACKFARERDEARAEVERLKGKQDKLTDEILANRRGLERQQAWGAKLAEAKALLRDYHDCPIDMPREHFEKAQERITAWLEANNERDALRAQLDEAKRAALGDVTANVELAKGTRALRAEVEQEGQRIEEYAGCRIAAWLKENDK